MEERKLIFVRVKQKNPKKRDLYFVGMDEKTIMAEAAVGTINGRQRLASYKVVSEGTVAEIFDEEIITVAVSSILTGRSTVFSLGIAA